MREEIAVMKITAKWYLQTTKYKTQNHWLHLQLKYCRGNLQKAIQELQEQLGEARRSRPESNTEENFTPEVTEASVEYSKTANTTAELSLETSTQTAEAPHTDSTELKTTKKQHEEIEQFSKLKNIRKRKLQNAKNKKRASAVRSQSSKPNSAPLRPCVKKGFEDTELETRAGKDQSFLPGNRREAKIGERKHHRETDVEKIVLRETLQSLQETRKKQETETSITELENPQDQNKTGQEPIAEKQAKVGKQRKRKNPKRK